MPKKLDYGLYVHVPYCKSRCYYCDFYSNATESAVPETYVKALERDFLRHAPTGESGQKMRANTVYFGGGTPSLLTSKQVENVLKFANAARNAEITLEFNPEAASLKKLQDLRKAGVNRLSFGLQTANNSSLRRLGRIHTKEDAKQGLIFAQKAGFENISADIMLALPHYSRQEFDETLQFLQYAQIGHISAYMLKLEAGTPFGKNPPAGVPNQDQAADFYLYATEKLQKAGFLQYEISNFAKTGFESRHNLLYWNMENWLGLGPSAHSSLFGQRFYFENSTANFLQDKLPKILQGKVEVNDYIMMRLRLTGGLFEKDLQNRFGFCFSFAQLKLLEFLCESAFAKKVPGGWALTPKGMLVQNQVLLRLLEE